MTTLFKNNAASTLASSLATAATSMTVATGHGDRFPVVASPDIAFVTLENAAGNIEIVKITTRTSGADSMTIVRGQEGTVARDWVAGDIVSMRITAASIQSALSEVREHVADTADAHAASAISNTPSGNLAATTVQAALNELQSDVDGRQAALGYTPVNKAGDTMTGGLTVPALTVNGTGPTVTLYDTDLAYGRYLHVNDYNIGFLTTAWGWAFRVDNDGNAVATGNVTAYSDIRLKTDLVQIDDAIGKVQQLTGWWPEPSIPGPGLR